MDRWRSTRWLMLVCAAWLAISNLATAQRDAAQRDAAQRDAAQREVSPLDTGSRDAGVPPALREWQEWALGEESHRNCPTPYGSSEQHLCFWPTRLSVEASAARATWRLQVTAYETVWVPLPGSADTWPMEVRDGEQRLPVVEREGRPSVRLEPGSHELSGLFLWASMPERLSIPTEIGVLSLTVDGAAVAIPNWGADGAVWLRRARSESVDEDQISADVYRVLEDGIPLWLRTEIELSVSGRSREEDLGWVLPEGWKLSLVDSPIPVAVDEAGRVKAQVRAGKWTIALHAFRTQDAGEVRYAANAEPIVPKEFVAFQAQPAFRVAELEGITARDANQTTFPERWRHLPLFEWNTHTPFRLVEKMRGMGSQRLPGLSIERQLWLDEDGRALTYSDRILGVMQRTWRLNASEGQTLGAVRVGGEGQLITADPTTGAPGFEVRTRNLNLEAIGRLEDTRKIPATGWQTHADSLRVHLILPPGWRLLALFGADAVVGDWLTAWTLLDLFLLLVFSLAVFRLWGVVPGVIAFLAFGLSYHEPGALRYCWFFLLIPLAILRVVREGWLQRVVAAWAFVAAAWAAVLVIPFFAQQIQSAIFPQLEPAGFVYGTHPPIWFGPGYTPPDFQMAFPGSQGELQDPFQDSWSGANGRAGRGEMISNAPASLDETMSNAGAKQQQMQNNRKFRFNQSNMMYDAKAKIQTGPAQPQWMWNRVECIWNGPVTADQTIRPIFISLPMHRVLTVARIALLLALLALLLRGRDGSANLWADWSRWWSKRGVRVDPGSVAGLIVAAWLLGGLAATPAQAQFPDATLLQQLRERLLKPSDAYPNSASLDSVRLSVQGNRLTMKATVHAIVPVAVPLPGRLAAWSPVTVQVVGQPETVALRRDGHLWISVPAGVHDVQVEGLLPEATEWDWSFDLVPRHVVIDAPDWTVTGVNASGVPEKQVFFRRKQQAAEGEAVYDRKDFAAVVAVDRELEVGLVWQVNNAVTRVSSPGKAISLRVPLLPGERVLTSGPSVREGYIEVRLGPSDTRLEWRSELPLGAPIELKTRSDDTWVERWHLVTSPVWNVTVEGLAPVFEADEQDLVPVWTPWPGESVQLAFHKPTEIVGETVTVQRVHQSMELGSRQRKHRLDLDLESSMGKDFSVELDPEAEISSLTQDDVELQVRRDGGKVTVPLKPGKQRIGLTWRTNERLESTARMARVTLPTPSANVWSKIEVPGSRWVLWADGPLRGPAVRFWAVLACALLAAWVLGMARGVPLNRLQWVLLMLGLTQVHVIAALVVVGWFFLLSDRAARGCDRMGRGSFNLRQLLIVVHTLITLSVLLTVVGEGLLGRPQMFIVGNGSTRDLLWWFQPRVEQTLPEPYIVSVSVWFYRLLMLAWALWLANSLVGWLKWAWEQFSDGGLWARKAA